MLISFHIQMVYCLLRQGLPKFDCLGSIACRRLSVATAGGGRLSQCMHVWRCRGSRDSSRAQ
jgi:hypothetical protein